MAGVSKEEEELRKISMQIRLLEQTAETLQSRIGMLNAAKTDLTYADLTLNGLEQEKENSELLVPIGGSSYIKVKLANPDKVVVGLGAGVSVEKTLSEAKSLLKGRLAALEKSLQAAQQQFNQVAERIRTDRNRLESLLAAVRQGNLTRNV